MKIPITILLLASLFAASCGEPPMPPSDEEMIRHFATHEAAFHKVYEIMSESSEGSFHYPPLSPEEVIILDSTEQSDTSHETNDEEDLPVYGLLKPDRIQLDSLLSEIGCGLVLVDRREWETADSVYVSLVMPYYSHGIVDAGTSNSFVYDPGLRSRRIYQHVRRFSGLSASVSILLPLPSARPRKRLSWQGTCR